MSTCHVAAGAVAPRRLRRGAALGTPLRHLPRPGRTACWGRLQPARGRPPASRRERLEGCRTRAGCRRAHDAVEWVGRGRRVRASGCVRKAKRSDACATTPAAPRCAVMPPPAPAPSVRLPSNQTQSAYTRGEGRLAVLLPNENELRRASGRGKRQRQHGRREQHRCKGYRQQCGGRAQYEGGV